MGTSGERLVGSEDYWSENAFLHECDASIAHNGFDHVPWILPGENEELIDALFVAATAGHERAKILFEIAATVSFRNTIERSPDSPENRPYYWWKASVYDAAPEDDYDSERTRGSRNVHPPKDEIYKTLKASDKSLLRIELALERSGRSDLIV